MARARIVWRVATARDVVEETARAKTIVLDVPGWPGHVAGQHADVRLTAEDGFTWRVDDGGPLLLVGGGSGLVPLMAMLRHRRAARGSAVDARLLVSARSWDDVLYRDELVELTDTDGVTGHYSLTRSQPAGWTGFARRVDAEMLTEVGPRPDQSPRIYVCGPTPFVESVADLLVDIGQDPRAIHAERFGPTGG